LLKSVFSGQDSPSGWKPPLIGARFAARVELLHPSKPKPGLPGTPVVPFPFVPESRVFQHSVKADHQKNQTSQR
jgi:hypothetical protein